MASFIERHKIEIDSAIADFYFTFEVTRRPAEFFEYHLRNLCLILKYAFDNAQKWIPHFIVEYTGPNEAEIISAWIVNPYVFQILQEARSLGCDWVDDAQKIIEEEKPKKIPDFPRETE